MASPYSTSRRTYENDVFEGDYKPGYEPSAPSYYGENRQQGYYYPGGAAPPPASTSADDLDEFPHSASPLDPSKNRLEPFLGQPEKDETLGGYLFTRMVRPLWRGSHTVLRIDLRRAIQYHPSVKKEAKHQGSAPAGTVASSGNYYDDGASHGWFHGISGGGARLKMMQIWDAPDSLLGESRRHWNVNVGFGLNVELDRGHLHPKCRLRARHLALHLLPQPEVEFRGKWPLGTSRLAINAKYRIPLTMSLEDMWTSSGARLMVNFFNPLGTGFHLTPGGVEFDEHLVQLGQHTKLRIAAALEFPRKLPLEEGEQPLKVRVHRLGLKTVIHSEVAKKDVVEEPSHDV